MLVHLTNTGNCLVTSTGANVYSPCYTCPPWRIYTLAVRPSVCRSVAVVWPAFHCTRQRQQSLWTVTASSVPCRYDDFDVDCLPKISTHTTAGIRHTDTHTNSVLMAIIPNEPQSAGWFFPLSLLLYCASSCNRPLCILLYAVSISLPPKIPSILFQLHCHTVFHLITSSLHSICL